MANWQFKASGNQASAKLQKQKSENPSRTVCTASLFIHLLHFTFWLLHAAPAPLLHFTI
jgi:hypothetical protein